MQIADLPVHHKIIEKLSAKGFHDLTPIQQQTILPSIQGKDVLASSQTGSGKTFAYLVPALHRLMTQKALSRKDPRALILAPTRELAKQVYQEAKFLCNGTNVKPALIIGGDNYNDQCKLLTRNPALIIGTAGRVVDHLSSRSFFLNGLELLILDEADRMLDLGFSEALVKINRQADHRKRQTLLFSATLDNISVKQLANTMVKAPVRVNIGLSTQKHDSIQQHFFLVDSVKQKDALLEIVLADAAYDQAIVFTATRDDTDRLVEQLNELKQGKFASIALRGDLPQSQRSAVMTAFSNGQHSILVTTDVASRGLDLPKVGMVVNFDLPVSPDEYIHRIGRTGRAGHSGVATSLVGKRDWKNYLAIQSHLDYAVEAKPHGKMETSFIGIKSTPTSVKKGGKKRPPPKAKTTAKKAKGERVDTMAGVEAGSMPIKRRKRPTKADD